MPPDWKECTAREFTALPDLATDVQPVMLALNTIELNQGQGDFMHIRIIVAAAWLMAAHLTAFGAIYKCGQAGGKIHHQGSPCANGQDISGQVARQVSAATSASASTPARAASAAKPDTHATSPLPDSVKKCQAGELRIHFPDMSLSATLQVLADIAPRRH